MHYEKLPADLGVSMQHERNDDGYDVVSEIKLWMRRQQTAETIQGDLSKTL